MYRWTFRRTEEAGNERQEEEAGIERGKPPLGRTNDERKQL
jgi:hypothetical protein